MDDDLLSMNSWPAFTDLMVSVVLILILAMGGVHVLASSSLNEAAVRDNQRELAHALEAPDCDVKPNNGFTEVWSKTSPSRLMVRLSPDPQDTMLQRISFSEFVLFSPDDVELKSEGQQILKRVGEAIKRQVANITEIQIHGHADPDRTNTYKDNLELASFRANRVYRFLRSDVGIDPARHLMSATSFAEFAPVGRERGRDFGPQELADTNRSAAQKQLNRRTELLLFYRRPKNNGKL